MPVAPPFAAPTRLAAAVVMLLVVAACGGSKEPMTSPGDKPEETTAEPQPVDVCTLLRPSDIDATLGTDVFAVSLEYGAPQVPTLTCGLGTQFGVALVSVQLATGPISANVFDDAYGPSAGGDPEPVDKLGEAAYFRNEPENLELHAFVNGAILTLDVANDAANPRTKKQIVTLARLAADRLPDNPRLAPTAPGSLCKPASAEAITAAIGTAPSVASSLTDDDGSVMCSWAARPGSVLISVLRAPGRIASYSRLLDESLYTDVDGVEGGKGVRVLSRTDKAGDLLIFQGTDAMAVITVVPTAGFSDASMLTTPGEIQLANSVITSLL